MKSLIEFSKEYDLLPKEVNAMMLRNDIYVSTTFGIDDGFIDIDLYDHIVEQYSRLVNNLKDKESIIDLSGITVPIKKGSYIYFLLDDREIVYVGQSFQLLGRIQNHIDNQYKVFNRISVIEVERKTINLYERAYIEWFKPNLNKTNHSRIDLIDCIIKSY